MQLGSVCTVSVRYKVILYIWIFDIIYRHSTHAHAESLNGTLGGCYTVTTVQHNGSVKSDYILNIETSCF